MDVVAGLVEERFDQRGLPDAGDPFDEDDARVALPDLVEALAKRRELVMTANQSELLLAAHEANLA